MNDLDLTVECPECGAKVGEGCVYLWPKGVSRNGQHNRSVQALIDKVGKPTERPHNGRYAMRYRKRKPQPAMKTRLQRFDMLVRFFHEHGDIFKE